MTIYKVRVTDENFQPITAVVTYTDLNGTVVGQENITERETTLNPALLDNENTFSVSFSARGFYDFDTDKYHLAEVSDITLQRKPSNTLAIVGGVSILAALLLLFKK
jgi:hypothetical protein